MPPARRWSTPHSQLIALPIVPKRVREEVDAARHYYREKERCIFCDMIRQEIGVGRPRGRRKRSIHLHRALRSAFSVRDVAAAQAAQLGI